MKLHLKEIKEITNGAVRIVEEESSIRLHRFTEEQEEFYRRERGNLYDKTLSAAGMKLIFKTNSKSLFFKALISKGSSRTYFSFDVFVDGKPVGYLDNYSDAPLPIPYTAGEFPLGEFSKAFSLGEGIKTVCVYLPWSVGVAFREISVEDGAFIEAVRPEKKLLTYGDSITHGYDSLHPSLCYTAKLAEALEAEEFNKAIGGETFCPRLAELKDGFVPDYITVAYGTNDWNSTEEEVFRERCAAFFAAVRGNYPTAKIFAITPIWRKESTEERKFGAFSKVEENIREIVSDIANVTVISGINLVPHEEKYFADFRLHPNADGFAHYFDNLYEKIKEEI